jgi:serine/threonine protein kinase
VRDLETGEQLALKRLLRADTQSVLRLKREFRSLADIHHPNLVKLYELGHDRISPFFTMEYLEGEELEDYLNQGAPPSAAINDNAGAVAARTARVLGAFEQLANGVVSLHRAGVLHRDLKPSNVMVSDGRVVVLDFGIALEVGEGAATVTLNKLASGTPAYMAPEQIQGKHLGEPNNWYAFGAMLYEALSGKLPIDGSLSELLRRKLAQDPCCAPTPRAHVRSRQRPNCFQTCPRRARATIATCRCSVAKPSSLPAMRLCGLAHRQRESRKPARDATRRGRSQLTAAGLVARRAQTVHFGKYAKPNQTLSDTTTATQAQLDMRSV